MNFSFFSVTSGVCIWAFVSPSGFLFIFISLVIFCFILNFVLQLIFNTTLSRKIGIVSNNPPVEPRCGWNVIVESKPSEIFIQKYNSSINEDTKIDFSFLLILALGRALKKANLDGKFIFGDFVSTDDVAVMAPVDSAGRILGPFVSRDTEKICLYQLREQLEPKVAIFRIAKSKEAKKRLRALADLPGFVIDIVVTIASFLSYNLELNIKSLTISKDFFGTCILSNIKEFKEIYDSSAPLVNFARNIISATLNSEKERLVVKSGQIQVCKTFLISMIGDSRIISPEQQGVITSEIKRHFENPSLFLS